MRSSYPIRRLQLYKFLCVCLSFFLLYIGTIVLQEYLRPVKSSGYINRGPGRYDVILNAYMNSGSTFTGRLLGFKGDNFYFYEPFWRLSEWSYYLNNNTMCSLRNTMCRKIQKREINQNRPVVGRRPEFSILEDFDARNASAVDVPLKILELLYSCDLIALRNIVQPGVTERRDLAGPSWEKYRQCQTNRDVLYLCLRRTESVCKGATHRVTKILRITPGNLEPILRKNPHLKVLHLFRDPRAIINSRLETKGYPMRFYPSQMSREMMENTFSLCNKMAVDLKEGLELIGKFPGRFRFIKYEKLIGDIYNTVKEIYDWLGMNYKRSEVDQLALTITNEPHGQNYLRETYRKLNNAAWWRKSMSWKQVLAVDKLCGDVIRQLDYPIFESEKDLRDIVIVDRHGQAISE